METLSQYVIPFKSLANGKHQFEMHVGKELFESIEGALVADGNLAAQVEMIKSEQMLKFHFAINGTVRVTCDVCLDEFDYPVEDCEGNIVVKFGDGTQEISDELYQLDTAETELSVAQWIYELIGVSLPIRFEHPADADGNSTCNPEMLDCLDKYLVNEKTAPDTATNDPRWDALKGLMK